MQGSDLRIQGGSRWRRISCRRWSLRRTLGWWLGIPDSLITDGSLRGLSCSWLRLPIRGINSGSYLNRFIRKRRRQGLLTNLKQNLTNVAIKRGPRPRLPFPINLFKDRLRYPHFTSHRRKAGITIKWKGETTPSTMSYSNNQVSGSFTTNGQCIQNIAFPAIRLYARSNAESRMILQSPITLMRSITGSLQATR